MRPRALAPKLPSYRGRALIGAALALLGCNIDNPGDEPPRGALYFPTALALSPHEPGSAPRYLFVASSNYDLRYKGGTVQAFALDRLAEESACARPPCAISDTGSVLEDEVIISSYATGLTVTPDGGFLLATTRTDDSLAFIPLDAEAEGDAVLDCGASDRGCGLYAARGANPARPDQRLAWPNDPAAVVAGPLSHWSGDADDDALYALVAHKSGEVSLFIEQPDRPRDDAERFELRAVLRGLQTPLTNIDFDATTGLAYLTIGSSGLARAGVVAPQGDDERGGLYFGGTVRLQALATAPDTRDVTFLPAVAGAGDALSVPTALVVANQPSALMLVDLDAPHGATDGARVKRTAVVGAGASRVATGMLGDRPTAIVACFDSRSLFVVDLQTMLTRSVVPNLSGPFELVFDEERARVYVADFKSSVIRVVDLAALAETQGEAPAAVIATLGSPRVLQELR